jgi:hypothetical protein
MAWLGTAGGNIVGVDTDVRDLDAAAQCSTARPCKPGATDLLV